MTEVESKNNIIGERGFKKRCTGEEIEEMVYEGKMKRRERKWEHEGFKYSLEVRRKAVPALFTLGACNRKDRR